MCLLGGRKQITKKFLPDGGEFHGASHGRIRKKEQMKPTKGIGFNPYQWPKMNGLHLA